MPRVHTINGAAAPDLRCGSCAPPGALGLGQAQPSIAARLAPAAAFLGFLGVMAFWLHRR